MLARKKFVLILIYVSMVFAVDFEPAPLEPENSKNLTSSSKAPIIELTTSSSPTKPIPTQRPVIPQNTTPKFFTTTTTTKSTTGNIVTENPQNQYPTSTNPIIELTTSSSITKPIPTQRPVIPQNTTPKFVTTTTTAESTTKEPQNQYPTMNWKPFYPSTQVQNCYFVKQRENLQCYWTWPGLRWKYKIDCYYCCEYDYSMFAGCNQVHHSYCDSCY